METRNSYSNCSSLFVMFKYMYKSILMLALFAELLTWYYPGYPTKSVLKLTISLFLLWLCSVHHHLPVFV